MRLINWFFIFVILLIGGVGVYFYYNDYLPLKKAFVDLQEENLRLVKLVGGRSEQPKNWEEKKVRKIVIQTDKIFKPGTDQLTTYGKKYLDELYAELEKSGFKELRIESHTDSIPVQTKRDKYPTNWELAAHRATEVVRYFISKGAPADRLVAVSYGDSRPIAPNSTKEGRKQNRRIEIIIVQ